MSLDDDLLIRNVEVGGHGGLDVLLQRGRIAEIGTHLRGGSPEIDGRGGALLPGLIDHHIHLLAYAAQATSVAVDPRSTADGQAFDAALRDAAAKLEPSAWVRATGYHDSVAGPLTRERLDQALLHRPIRVQQATGSLWVLNSLALRQVLCGDPPPPCVELDANGEPTGRIWRGDNWLRERLPTSAPPLSDVARRLAAWGVTGLTDASASTGESQAALFAQAVRKGMLPQRLMLMSAGELRPPAGGEFHVGPVKILLDEAELPDPDDMVKRIRQARRWQRRVAVHCVTAAELAWTLTAFETTGSLPGDRIEHGGVIPEGLIPAIAKLGLTVVTQPAFIAERGDRYRREVDVRDHDSLYRSASLLRAGIKLAGSSDAPYTVGDPWAAMAAAVQRETCDGHGLGREERLTPSQALALFLGPFEDPGAAPRPLEIGAPADLCLLHLPLRKALQRLSAALVAATVIAGRIVHGPTS